MTPVKTIAFSSSVQIRYADTSRFDIRFPARALFRPSSGNWAGNALHDHLQFGVVDAGIAPMVSAFKKYVGSIADQYTSDRRVFVPGLYEGKTDWDMFCHDQIQAFEFKWAMDGIPVRPRDVDVRQIALYAYALHRAFDGIKVWFRLAYFFGGKPGQPAGIRVFSFRNSKQLLGIARKILKCF